MCDSKVLGTNLLNCFVGALGAIEGSGIRMFELRPRDKSFEEVFCGDYDFVVNSNDLGAIIQKFIDACVTHGVHLVVVGTALNKRVLRLVKRGRQIVVELWLSVEMAGTGGLADRRQISGTTLTAALGNRGDDEANAIRAAIYLTHLYYKNKAISHPLQQRRLKFFREVLIAASASGTEEGSAAKKRLTMSYHRILSNDGADLAAANRDALAYLVEQGLSPARRRLLTLRRSLNRDWGLVKRIVPVMGPDGSGKTYLCKYLLTENPERRAHFPYKQFFRNRDYKFLIRGLRAIFKGEEKNQLDERIAHYVIAKSTLVSLWWSLLLSMRSNTLFVDRYGWDYLFTGIRGVNRPPARIRMHSVFLRMIPRPSKCIIMIGRTETILARKLELEEQQIAFIYGEYINYVADGRARRVFFCNTEMDYEWVRSDLTAFLKGS
jgi:hypothetical protein